MELEIEETVLMALFKIVRILSMFGYWGNFLSLNLSKLFIATDVNNHWENKKNIQTEWKIGKITESCLEGLKTRVWRLDLYI